MLSATPPLQFIDEKTEAEGGQVPWWRAVESGPEAQSGKRPGCSQLRTSHRPAHRASGHTPEGPAVPSHCVLLSSDLDLLTSHPPLQGGRLRALFWTDLRSINRDPGMERALVGKPFRPAAPLDVSEMQFLFEKLISRMQRTQREH